jgi:monofunctional chorismate mutase, alpha proteobacterial type
MRLSFDTTFFQVARLSAMARDPEIELRELRGSIDNIDAALIHLLAERFKNTKRVGRLKAQAMMPPSDPEREAWQIARLRRLAEEADLDPGFAEKFLEFILEEVIQHHEALAADSE